MNPTDRVWRVSDLTLRGVSVLAKVRAEWLVSGRLEDADDAITILPGERLDLSGDAMEWTED